MPSAIAFGRNGHLATGSIPEILARQTELIFSMIELVGFGNSASEQNVRAIAHIFNANRK
jgi:hypothetical protein